MNLRENLISINGDFPELAAAIYDAWLAAPTDKEILGGHIEPGEENADTLLQKDTYAWYWAFSSLLTPDKIGEIGVLFGYSALALLAPHKNIPLYIGYDAQLYAPDSNERARAKLPKNANVILSDTQKVYELLEKDFDLLHIDGDHTEEGASHDLALAKDAVKSGGWIIVDDIAGLHYPSCEGVKPAADKFIRKHNLKYLFLPTFRGMYVIRNG